jgi:hypothetical protein
MLINQIDELFDNVLNKLYEFLNKKDVFKMLTNDPNFVIYQKKILLLIQEFIKTIDSSMILKIIKKENNLEYILNVIKRYCAFYIYLAIGYYYTKGRDLYITNIIESAKNQKDTTIQIENFFNSENNSKIINFFNDIQNIKSLAKFKTIDKIKIIISNNPIKFDSIIKLFEELGEDYVINNFLVKDNLHNIIKTIIFKQLYMKEEKYKINEFNNEIEKEISEYKYIEVIVSSSSKLVDFNIIQKFLTLKQLRAGLAEEIYTYLEENKQTEKIIIRENQDFINYLFTNKILVPITEEILRYHKDTEKYETEYDIKKDDTKIKSIIKKINSVRCYYSIPVNKNLQLKQEIENYFFKNLDPRMAILYNDNEEIKIIQKLKMSNSEADDELLIELDNMRKYAYINFKNSDNINIKLRTGKTVEAIRYVNLKKKKSENIETRIGHDNITLNVRGVAFNPSRLNLDKSKKILTPLECYKIKNLVNVKELTNNKNGFLSFIKILEKSVNRNKNNLYYWIFDKNTDIPKINKYIDYNKYEPENNFNLMLYEIYNIWIDLVQTKFTNYLNKIDNITNMDLEYLINAYEKKYFNFQFNPDIKNSLLLKALTEKFKEIEIIDDITDSIIPGKRNKIIELPTIDIKISYKNIIKINDVNEIVEPIYHISNNAQCYHHVRWSYINNLPKDEKNNFNQYVFEFVKKYVKLDEKSDFICKSCDEILELSKFVYEGDYNKELGQYQATSLAIQQELTTLSKYINLKRTIKNLEKNLEKIAYLTDLSTYIGNYPAAKFHRKNVIKDTIDLILLHTTYIKKQPVNRIDISCRNYNLKKEFINLFFFELKEEIFLTSSLDTDYYKLIKYNNVIVYLILIIITELNSGQILNFKNDIRCNYLRYSKLGDTIFKDLFLRINHKEKILFTKLPVLSYIIYYFTCILTENHIWLWKEDNTEKKAVFNIYIQKTIIHTLIDLINSIIEANLETDKNYLYEILTARFFTKLKSIFNDTELLKKIDININKRINFDEKTKIISFLKKKIIYISIDKKNIEDEQSSIKKKEYCEVKTKIYKKVKVRPDNNNINSLTNCDDGNFHQWVFVNGNMVCELCKTTYYDLIKQKNTTTETETETDIYYYDKLKMLFLKKLTKKYCLTGNLHKINFLTGICNLCNINPIDYKYTDKELKKFETILDSKKNQFIIEQFKIIELKEKIIIKNKELSNDILDSFKKNFKIDMIDKYLSNNLENYIMDFIDRLIKILGEKIKIKNKVTYLKDTLYILDHDHFGNSIKQHINILSSDNLIITYLNHPIFNKDILYYKDKAKKIYVYYDIVSLQYLGYSDDNKNIRKNKNNASLKIEYSIKDCLLLLGLENVYTDLYHLNSDLIHNFNPNPTTIFNDLQRNRIINLKQIINRIKSIISSVQNHSKITEYYNYKEKEIVNEFTTKLKQFNTTDDKSDEIFKNSIDICNLINLTPNSQDITLIYNKNFINNEILNKTINGDTKLLYFIIMNLNKLLDYNKQTTIESELAHLIVRIIQFSLGLYIKENNIYEIRKFEFLLLNDISYIDEMARPKGLFEDLVTSEIDEEKINELKYDNQEAMDSLDIEDYKENNFDLKESVDDYNHNNNDYDEIDSNIEALDSDIIT